MVDEEIPSLSSPVLVFFADHGNREVLVLAAFAPHAKDELFRDADGWTPIVDWATRELLRELDDAGFTHVRLGNRGPDAVTFQVRLAELHSHASEYRR